MIDIVDTFVIMEQGRIVNELTNQAFKQLTTEDLQQYGLRSTTIEQIQFKSVKIKDIAHLILSDCNLNTKDNKV